MPRTILLDTPSGKKEVIIPTRMRVRETSRVYVDMLLRIVQHHMSKDGHGIMDGVRLRDGAEFILHINKQDGDVFWSVEDFVKSSKLPLAAGFFYDETDAYREFRAAAVPHMRGRGLYKAVLHRLRAFLGKSLLSDKVLSVANVCVWVSAGGVPDDKHAGFRINPKDVRLESAIQCLLALEISP